MTAHLKAAAEHIKNFRKSDDGLAKLSYLAGSTAERLAEVDADLAAIPDHARELRMLDLDEQTEVITKSEAAKTRARLLAEQAAHAKRWKPSGPAAGPCWRTSSSAVLNRKPGNSPPWRPPGMRWWAMWKP